MTIKTVFLLSGQGSQYYQMGRQLYDSNTVFRHHMNRLDQTVLSISKDSIIQILYHDERTRKEEFSRTIHTHPAIFMVEFSLAKALIFYGVKPDYLFGSSLGEYVAAALSGMASSEDILRTIVRRAQSIENFCTPGMMLTILYSSDLYHIDTLLNQHSTLVSIHHNKNFVISGTRKKLVKIYQYLKNRGITVLKLPISHGFHSHAIDSSYADMHFIDTNTSYKSPRIPTISCLKGHEIKSIYFQDYFWNVGRQPILFQKALKYLFDTLGNTINFVDVGPSGTMASFVKRHLDIKNRHNIFTILTSPLHEVDNFSKIINDLGTNSAEVYSLEEKE